MTESQKKSLKMIDKIIPQTKKMKDKIKEIQKKEKGKKLRGKKKWTYFFPLHFVIEVIHTQGKRGKKHLQLFYIVDHNISIRELQKWINKKVIPIVEKQGKIKNVSFRFSFMAIGQSYIDPYEPFLGGDIAVYSEDVSSRIYIDRQLYNDQSRFNYWNANKYGTY